jgi:hypothetical protein
MRCPEFIRFMRRCGFELVRVGGYRPTSRLWESAALRSRARDAE